MGDITMTDRHFFNCNIAGFSYYDGIDVFYELKIGSELKLKVETDNKFDAYAVAIYFHDVKLGYIPQGENKLLSKFCYENLFEVHINRITPDVHPEKQIGISIRIKEKMIT
ncbi:MAG: HIRAN domain-containing protein [Prevotellaceae bacterium]|jgi:hypothetical protein|nr:HIRAN domain-containing protein [Prevotellaceae bacterium]